MWLAYTGFTNAQKSKQAIEQGIGTGGPYTDYIRTRYTIEDGEWTYKTNYYDSNNSIDYDTLYYGTCNVFEYIPTTTTSFEEFYIRKTTITSGSSAIVGTYSVTTSSPEQTTILVFSNSFTFSKRTETNVLSSIQITTTRTVSDVSSLRVGVGFESTTSNVTEIIEMTGYADVSLGHYTVVHPRIGYPWTADGSILDFLWTYTDISGSNSLESSTFRIAGTTGYGGLQNLVKENATDWPKTFSASSQIISISDFGVIQSMLPSNQDIITISLESINSFTYHSIIVTASSTVTINSRFYYNSSVSFFDSLPQETKAVLIYTTSVEDFSESISPLVTYRASDTYLETYSFYSSYEDQYLTEIESIYYTSREYIALKTTTLRITCYTTDSYFYVNSDQSICNLYLNSFTYTGFAKTTASGRSLIYQEPFTLLTTQFGYTRSVQGGTSQTADFNKTIQFVGDATIQIFTELYQDQINRVPPNIDSPVSFSAETVISASPNYNFAVCNSKSTVADPIFPHGGYFKKIVPTNVLRDCYWTVYKFERSAVVEVPVLAVPINTSASLFQSGDVLETTQSVSFGKDFLFGSGVASISRTSKSPSGETTTSYSCSYQETESYEFMGGHVFTELNDFSTGVVGDYGKINCGADKPIALTTFPVDFAPNMAGFIGQKFYLNYAPLRYTRGFVGNGASGIPENPYFYNLNLFTLIGSSVGGNGSRILSQNITYKNSWGVLP